MSVDYQAFIASKHKRAESHGFDIDESHFPAEHFKPFQAAACRFAVRRGRAALFEGTGLGKTRQELAIGQAWLDFGGIDRVLLLAPLGVNRQTVAEGKKVGIDVTLCRSHDDVRPGINITNYEMLHAFKAEEFGGVILDESSILKNFMGQTKRKLCEAFANTRYRLCATATPSPNDHLELGNQSDFLGIMPANQMISRWFINNTMEAGDYRLKGHAAADFWKWVSSWALCIGKPSDIGYDDAGYDLPPLTINHHVVDSSDLPPAEGMLFHLPELSATNIHKELRSTSEARARNVADRVNATADPYLVWCYTDYDADELTKLIPDAVEIRGSMPIKTKEDRLSGFVDGTIRVLISKPGVCGFGLNFQHCHRCDFVGLTYGFESFYQAVRRIYRFGQTRPVECNVVCSDSELALLETVQRKEQQHVEMFREMASAMKASMLENLGLKQLAEYRPTVPLQLPNWLQAECVQ